jgi:exodeoxyribonuclease V gamma subunit
MLHVHRAERADGLVQALRSLLAEPPADPFAQEVVAVPTRGMERWLTQRMSERLGATPGRSDGVCANVGFPPPRRIVGDAVATVSGIDPDADAWVPERMVWPLLEAVDDALAEPWLQTLAAHLGGPREGADPVRRARRFAAVRHIADLYDRYALHRPEMVRAWARAEDTDGAGRPLAPGAVWQAELWRRLRARIAQPDPAERLEGACARLRERPDLLDLPERLALFGLTRLPAGHLEVLRAIAAGRDVHLLLLHPSPALWERVDAALRDGGPVARRSGDHTAALPQSRLLASWGHDVREMQLVVAGAGDHADHHHAVGAAANTLLGRIQADVRADRVPPGPPLPGHEDTRALLDPGDRSVQVHACHGRARQVEVVRDAILHMLADDPSLEPRDVIVMCPDIELFAPLIQATFGAGEVSEQDDEIDALPEGVRPPDLRVRLADRSLRQTNPVLGVVARLIDLAAGRLTASEVLDLAAREPVRRRFRLDDDDLARMESWVADSGIRWGLDAEHRAPFKLDVLETGTWRAGLDRLLVGVTMTEEDQRLFGGVLPLEDVESGAIDLAGRLAELVDRLREALDALSEPKPVDAWVEAIGDAADALAATSQRDAWQRSELQRILDDVRTEAAAGGQTGTELALAEVRALLADRLQGRPTRANFRTGHLTICTLVPMRSVPHRVVCLLGLDDGAFPRRSPRDGDDLLLEDPHVGDRDSRTEDRQMLLDALMAATDRLVVTYTGNDERTNTPRPPAVPVGELLDVVDRTARTDDGAPARERVVVAHPLQPFDVRNFTIGELVPQRAWSFDRVTRDGARALARERSAPRPFLDGPLPDERSRLVEIEDLVRFVERPVRAFLRLRLGISVAEWSDEVDDALPVELDGLGEWEVGDRLLSARLAGADARAAAKAEIARGTLPPGVLGKPVIDRVAPTVEAIVEQAQACIAGAGDPASVDVRVELPDGRTLSGTVPGVSGDVLRSVTYSRVNPRHRLGAWVRLLALTAAHPERPFRAVTVGRASSGQGDVTVVRIRPLAEDAAGRREAALAHLATLLDLFDRGMREPPPVACFTSAAYAEAARDGRDAIAAGRAAWESEWNRDKEDREPDHRLVFGGCPSFAELLDEPSRADEDGDGWAASDGARFGRWARRLWAGLLPLEEVADL